MKTGTFNIDLTFDQILNLVRQLPKKDKIRLSRELGREIIGVKLTSLLKAFKTDGLGQGTINKEAEIVRSEFYAKSKALTEVQKKDVLLAYDESEDDTNLVDSKEVFKSTK